MLSALPSLLSYNQLSPFLIRLALGAIFIFWAYRTLRNTDTKIKTKVVGLIEGVAGILVFIGLWTQVAAAILLVDLIVRLVNKIMKKSFLTDGVNYYLVLLIMTISLLVTGAGWYGFDLPL